jgi:hypothetical protein
MDADSKPAGTTVGQAIVEAVDRKTRAGMPFGGYLLGAGIRKAAVPGGFQERRPAWDGSQQRGARLTGRTQPVGRFVTTTRTAVSLPLL